MDQDPIYVPFGLPPGVEQAGEETTPDAVTYFRVYAVIMTLVSLSLAGSALYAVIEMSARPSPATDEMLIWVGVYGTVGLVMAVPWVVAILGGRRKWVHPLGMILLIITMVTVTCCLPVAIPLLVAWLKPEVKRWFGSA